MEKKSEFETRMNRIQEISQLLNDQSTDFEKLIELYEEALKHIAECKKLLDSYEAKYLELKSKGNA